MWQKYPAAARQAWGGPSLTITQGEMALHPAPTPPPPLPLPCNEDSEIYIVALRNGVIQSQSVIHSSARVFIHFVLNI